jgi:NADPH-dependent 2,4-dienoyl-CoA reductase/sulfur reductase-like enzyme
MNDSNDREMGLDYFKDVPAHVFEPEATDKPLDIAIIGAGIAGLAAAAGLSRCGHNVEVGSSPQCSLICLTVM